MEPEVNNSAACYVTGTGGVFALCSTVHTHSGRSAGVEAAVAKPPKEGGLPCAGVPHQDDLEEAVGRRGATFLLKKQEVRWQRLKEGFVISL